MTITALKYASPDNDVYLVTYQDGTGRSVPVGSDGHFPTQVADAITGGIVVTAADAIDDMIAVRGQRDAMLAQSDWTQLADTSLSAGDVTLAATYRQTLRDVPSAQPGVDITTVAWPAKPSFL